jgi:hypothetical protein
MKLYRLKNNLIFNGIRAGPSPLRILRKSAVLAPDAVDSQVTAQALMVLMLFAF